MRMSPTRARPLFAAVLAAALFGLAPAAAAQELFPVVGAPIAFQVGLPTDWEVGEDEDMLFATNESEDVLVMVAASDLMADAENPLPVSDVESRRIFTNMLLESDSLLLALLEGGIVGSGDAVDPDAVVKEIRALGGQRAAYMRGPFVEDGEAGWFEIHVTVKDGIIYMVAFMVKGDGLEANAPLFARIVDSLVLAEAPPS